MPFDDFSKKVWIVIPPGSEECKTGETVEIAMSADGAVTIKCGGKAHYGGAKYNEGNNRIETETHDIRLQIVFVPKDSGRIGGSWTAEDTSGGVSGGGDL
jgi:hypothetical protein